jgi:beta-lactamase superfamily II metal-dependent hydrolase
LPAIEAPPGATEAEVSLFGPGRGEAIAVHLGYEQWMLVDSCLDEKREPATLAYLDRIGVSPNQVVLVVATHWHDDHIRGLAEVVRACDRADFSYSLAMSTREFTSLVGAHSDRSQMDGPSGVAEFAAISDFLRRRRRSSLRPALESRRLWFRETPDPPAVIEALAPCDIAIAKAQEALARLLPTKNSTKLAVVAPKPNHASVVLGVSFGEAHLLLGADLEETATRETGWTALLDRCDLPEAVSVFKVPHHGSPNADQPRVWSEVLSERPWALVAPYGNSGLPSDTDQKRLRARTDRAYLTAPPKRTRRKRDQAVERTLDEMSARPVNIDPPMGHIRLRCDAETESDWNVALFDPALHID